MAISIRFEGYVVAHTSRIYNFDVIDALGESRQFDVKVPAESFRPTFLTFQDGPAICFERLKVEIDGETQESHAKAHLNIGDPDIQEYLERHHPRKIRKKHPAMKVPTEAPESIEDFDPR
jgi:hypothetical protein